MINNEIECISLSNNIVEIGFNLLYEFKNQFSLKANIRNTIYDILILATAIDEKATLITKDSVLNRFTADYAGVTFDINANFLKIKFSKLNKSVIMPNRESKRYINRGWRVRQHNTRGA